MTRKEKVQRLVSVSLVPNVLCLFLVYRYYSEICLTKRHFSFNFRQHYYLPTVDYLPISPSSIPQIVHIEKIVRLWLHSCSSNKMSLVEQISLVIHDDDIGAKPITLVRRATGSVRNLPAISSLITPTAVSSYQWWVQRNWQIDGLHSRSTSADSQVMVTVMLVLIKILGTLVEE